MLAWILYKKQIIIVNNFRRHVVPKGRSREMFVSWCVCVCVCVCVLSLSNFLWPHGLQPTSLLCSWDFPGKNTGVGCHFLLQRIFPVQGSNLFLLYLLHWQVDSLPLSHLGSPYKLINDLKLVKALMITKSKVKCEQQFLTLYMHSSFLN